MEIRNLKTVVTGAGSGMGRHFAIRLAEQGAKVAAWDLNEDALSSLKGEIENLSGEIYTFKVNVSIEEEVNAAMVESNQKMKGINSLINNAGITRDGLLIKQKDDEIKLMGLNKWQQVIDVNLTGPFLCIREFAHNYLKCEEESQGVVVNISSISRLGNMGQSNYSAAKAGLVADTVVWAKELAKYGVRVGAIAPGFINTPILRNMRPEMLERMLQPVPLNRVGEPEEIWQAIRFILECGYFTGRCIEVDGGLRI